MSSSASAANLISKSCILLFLLFQIQTKLAQNQSSSLNILHIAPITPSQGTVQAINSQSFINYARSHEPNKITHFAEDDAQPQNTECKTKINALLSQTLSGNLTNSSPYIMYSGHDVNDLGMFTQCLNLPDSRYVVMCISGGVPLAVNVILCAPQECTPWDDYTFLKVPVAQQINNAMLAVTPQGGEEPHVQPDQVNFFDSMVTVSYMQDLLKPLFIFFYVLTFGYIALVIGITIYHYVQLRKLADEEPRLAQHGGASNLYKSLTVGDHNDREPCAKKCMMSLSLITSFNTLFKQKRDGDEKDFQILNFMRFVAMLWFILGNTYMYTLMQPLTNYLDVFDEVPKFVMLPITSSSLAPDIFLLISGFLATYILCRATLKSSSGMPLFIWTWIHRAIRIWPLYLAIFIWWEWIVPYFNTGPMWFSYYTTIVQDCTTYWYLHVLFINNLFPSDYETRCMPWTYYIALDFQLQLLVPLFVWLFMKKNRLGYISLALVYIIFLIVSISLVSKYHLSYSLMKRREFFYNKVYQMKPWTRCGPFFIGIVFAWAYFQHKYEGGAEGSSMQRRLGHDNGASTGASDDIERGCLQKFNTLLKEAKVVKIGVFLFGLFLQFLFALLIYNMNKYPSDWSQSADSFYLLFGKSLYILGVMFCTYPIMLNERWFIRKLFSFSIWDPLAKLCFGAYLIAPLWCYFMAFGTWKGRFYSGWMTALFFIGYVVLSFGIAVIASLFYEQPWARIEKVFCKTAKLRRSTEAEEEFLSKLQSGYGMGKKGSRFNEMQLQEDV